MKKIISLIMLVSLSAFGQQGVLRTTYTTNGTATVNGVVTNIAAYQAQLATNTFGPRIDAALTNNDARTITFNAGVTAAALQSVGAVQAVTGLVAPLHTSTGATIVIQPTGSPTNTQIILNHTAAEIDFLGKLVGNGSGLSNVVQSGAVTNNNAGNVTLLGGLTATNIATSGVTISSVDVVSDTVRGGSTFDLHAGSGAQAKIVMQSPGGKVIVTGELFGNGLGLTNVVQPTALTNNDTRTVTFQSGVTADALQSVTAVQAFTGVVSPLYTSIANTVQIQPAGASTNAQIILNNSGSKIVTKGVIYGDGSGITNVGSLNYTNNTSDYPGVIAGLGIGTNLTIVTNIALKVALDATNGAYTSATNFSRNAGNLATGQVPTAQLGSGSASSGTVLFGNGVWGSTNILGGGGGSGPTYTNDTGLPGVVTATAVGTNLSTLATKTNAVMYGTTFKSADVGVGALYHLVNPSKLSIDWNAGELYPNDGIQPSVRWWQGTLLKTNGGNITLDWQNRALYGDWQFTNSSFAGGNLTNIGNISATGSIAVANSYFTNVVFAEDFDSGHATNLVNAPVVIAGSQTTVTTNTIAGTGQKTYTVASSVASGLLANQFTTNAVGSAIRADVSFSNNVSLIGTSPILTVRGTSGSQATFDIGDGDVATGVTSLAPTTSFFHIAEASSTGGGALLIGLADAATDEGIEIRGVTSSSPNDGVAAVTLNGFKASGTSVAALGATSTVLDIDNNSSPIIRVLGNSNVTFYGSVTMNQLDYKTNAGAINPNMLNSYSLVSTGAAFKILLPTGVDTTQTKVQTSVLFVTNTLAAATAITLPDAPVKTTGTWYVTNLSAITTTVYPKVVTNMICLPIF